MHQFIFPNKTAWISSGSNSATTGISQRDQNFGQDEILELKKEYFNLTFDYPTRFLVQFKLNDIEASLSKSKASLGKKEINNPKYFLRLYEAEGNQEISTEYKVSAFAISQSWDEGSGKVTNAPKIKNGVSWENRKYPINGNALTWSNASGVSNHGVSIYTGSWNASQSFSYESPDIEMDITNMVNGWLNKDIKDNNGILLRFSGSQETNNQTFGHHKFFSRHTHTIYPPRLEIRWDDHSIITGSATGSLLPLSMSGLVDNYISMPGLRESYRENEKIKFRVKPRKRYIQKSFSTSVQTVSGSYIPEGSGSYSIIDIATGETIVPFSAYTSMSCDATSNYFVQWLSGFYPDRVYKIIYKLKYADGQEQIFDNNFEFTIKR